MSNTVSENYKSLKIILRPTEEQKEFFNKSIGCMRLAYNEQLNHKINFYAENISPLKENSSKQEISKAWKTYKDLLASELKIKYPFMKEVSVWVVQFGIRRCNSAFDNFIKSQGEIRKGRKIGFPKYKSKKESVQSFQMLNVDKRKHFDFKGKQLNFQKLEK